MWFNRFQQMKIKQNVVENSMTVRSFEYLLSKNQKYISFIFNLNNDEDKEKVLTFMKN